MASNTGARTPLTAEEIKRLRNAHIGTSHQCPIDMQPRPCMTERWVATLDAAGSRSGRATAGGTGVRAKLHARLLELRTEAADAAARAEMLVISPEEMQEVTSAALAGELGEGLAAVALARIEELAGEARPREGDMKDALRHIYETARHARRSHKTVT